MKIPLKLIKTNPSAYWPYNNKKIVDKIISTGYFKLEPFVLNLKNISQYLDKLEAKYVALCAPRMPNVSNDTISEIMDPIKKQKKNLVITANKTFRHPILLKYKANGKLIGVDAEGVWKKTVTEKGFVKIETREQTNVYRRQDYPNLVKINYFLIVGEQASVKKYFLEHQVHKESIYFIKDEESFLIASNEDEEFYNVMK